MHMQLRFFESENFVPNVLNNAEVSFKSLLVSFAFLHS